MKKAGMAAAVPAAASAFGHAAITCAGVKPFCINFNGPFCFWLEETHVKVMAPPVGATFMYPHQAWMATASNETQINVESGTDLTLNIKGYTPTPDYRTGGTTAFSYPQGTGGEPAIPMFNLRVPKPYMAIGVHPTVVKMRCKNPTECKNSTECYCTKFSAFSSGVTFFYPAVDLEGMTVMTDGPNSTTLFRPCFTNDEILPNATLAVNLTPTTPVNDDHEHIHAKAVWQAMLSMYPWMREEITGIDFCPNFKPSECAFDPRSCGESKEPMPMVGPGNDCQVPIMCLPPGGGGTAK
jgi:hypothetical protein